MKSKKASHLKHHAMRRATSRFELGFTGYIYECACKCIQEQREVGDCKPIRHLEKQSNVKSLWLLEIKGEQLMAAYDKSRKVISTFMPVGYREDLMEDLI